MLPLERTPRCALRVGIAGNRRFAGEPEAASTADARATIARAAFTLSAIWSVLFASIERAPTDSVTGAAGVPLRVDDRLCTPEIPLVTVVSSLAAGSDQLAVQTALRESRACRNLTVEIEAVLPFAAADYPGEGDALRPEFRPDEARVLRELTATARRVLRLDGDYTSAEGRLRAYRKAREMVLRDADFLIAVFDPAAAPRPGGTVETLRVALDSGTPVIAALVTTADGRIAVDDGRPSHDRPPQLTRETSFAPADLRWRTATAECVRHLLVARAQDRS